MLCFVPNGGFMITVSQISCHLTSKGLILVTSIWMKSTFSIPISSTFPRQIPRASSSTSTPIENLLFLRISKCIDSKSIAPGKYGRLSTALAAKYSRFCFWYTYPHPSIQAQIVKIPQPHPRSTTVLSSISPNLDSIVCNMHAENKITVFVHFVISILSCESQIKIFYNWRDLHAMCGVVGYCSSRTFGLSNT